MSAALPRATLPTLPREARDTLFLLATIAAVLLPHASHLPWWCTAVTAVVLAWRARLAWRSEALPGRWSLVVVLALVLGLTWLSHRTLIGREAGITMLAMLMALKTLELRARRDAFVVFFLGFFLVLTQFLYSQSLLTALWMLPCVWALLSALVLAQMPQGQPSLALAARIAARTTLLGLPIMLVLFLLFPRLPPLWGLPNDAGARTGLSNQLSFGAFTEVSNDESIAMRLRFEGAPPPRAQLYFRAQVLTRFDGITWHAPRWPFGIDPGPEEVQGPVYRYRMTLEPLRVNTLPVLDFSTGRPGERLPTSGDLVLTRSAQGQWLAPRPITERLRLDLQAHAGMRWGRGQTLASLRPELDLPPNLNPRSLALGTALAQRFQDLAPDARALAISNDLLRRIRNEGFTYTLAPGLYGENSPHLIDEFWFDRRLGFCEHFAAAYVVLMRAAGVPARVVTGLQGADKALQDGDLIVRMSQAHAWAEFWSEGQGWLRVDPTGAVAPERIRDGQLLANPPGVLAGTLNRVSPELWLRLRAAWEGLNNRWQQQVLNFSSDQQFDLLKRLGWNNPDLGALVQLTGLVLAGVALAGAAFTAWQRRPHDRWSRQRARQQRELARLGLRPGPQDTPRQWAQQLLARHGEAARALADALLQLEAQRYRQDQAAATPQWQQHFLALCADLRKTLPPGLSHPLRND